MAERGKEHYGWKGGKKARRKRMYDKLKNSLKYQLNRRIRYGMWKSLKGNKNGEHWESLVNYNIKQLENYLYKTMPEGYIWANFMNGDLHIDHETPISEFSFTKPEDLQFQQCWALDNLRLLPANENRKKYNKLIKSYQICLKI